MNCGIGQKSALAMKKWNRALDDIRESSTYCDLTGDIENFSISPQMFFSFGEFISIH